MGAVLSDVGAHGHAASVAPSSRSHAARSSRPSCWGSRSSPRGPSKALPRPQREGGGACSSSRSAWCAFFSRPFLREEVVTRAESIYAPKTQEEASGAGRTELWKGAIRTARENPILGVGYGSFPIISQELILHTPGVEPARLPEAQGGRQLRRPQHLSRHGRRARLHRPLPLPRPADLDRAHTAQDLPGGRCGRRAVRRPRRARARARALHLGDLHRLPERRDRADVLDHRRDHARAAEADPGGRARAGRSRRTRRWRGARRRPILRAARRSGCRVGGCRSRSRAPQSARRRARACSRRASGRRHRSLRRSVRTCRSLTPDRPDRAAADASGRERRRAAGRLAAAGGRLAAAARVPGRLAPMSRSTRRRAARGAASASSQLGAVGRPALRPRPARRSSRSARTARRSNAPTS